MNKKIKSWDYLWYALYAFAGLGLEILLLSVVEPMIFGGVISAKYTPSQMIIHWILTMGCWGIMSYFLVRSAKEKLEFTVLNKGKQTIPRIIFCVILIVFCVIMNAFDWGTLKIIAEFQKKGLLLFVFQYLYYFFEVILVFLIVVFGQKFFESFLHKKSNIPWGGVVLCCTWGAVHILTKGSLYTGIGVMVFSLLYGLMYVLLERDTRWVYLGMVIAFVI